MTHFPSPSHCRRCLARLVGAERFARGHENQTTVVVLVQREILMILYRDHRAISKVRLKWKLQRTDLHIRSLINMDGIAKI